MNEATNIGTGLSLNLSKIKDIDGTAFYDAKLDLSLIPPKLG